MADRASFDSNNNITLMAVSNGDGVTPVNLWADPTTHLLQVSSSGGGGGGGTQYQELATTSPATGTLSLGRYSSSLPTLTNGQMNEPMLDSSSRLLINGSGVTQPVSGTVTANAGSGTFNIQSNASINNAQVSGTAVSVNNGTTDAGTQRVTLSSDSTGQVKLATGSNTIGALTANQSVNMSQVGGSNVALGNTTMTASIPVTLASNDTNTAPFVTSGGGGYVRQDSTATIAKESGGNLATIATNTTGLATSANQTNGTQQSKITDGTNIANVAANNTSTSGNAGNPLLVASAGVTTGTLTLNSGSPNTVWYDLLNYPAFSIEILTNTTPATLTFQTSGDASQTNIRNTIVMDSQTNNGAGVSTTTTTNATFIGTRTGRYFRVSSNNGAGTTTLVITFYTSSSTFPVVGGSVAVSGTATVAGAKTNNNAAPGATNVGALVGIANAAAPSYSEGNEILLSTDLSGNQRTLVTGGLMPTNTALNTYSVHITSNTTTTPTSSTAYISCISISSEVAGTTSTITIQDKQGTPLKLVNGFSTTTLTTTPTTVNFQTPVKMVSGIDIVTAGAAAATVDVWINWYQ